MTRRKRTHLLDATGAEIDPNSVVVAIESFAAGDNPVIVRGQRLRADHEAVQLTPSMFVPDGLSNDQLNAIRQQRFPG